MKLISLNTWGGKVYEPLIEFIKKNSKDSDIFCFQEIYDTSSNVKQFKQIRASLLHALSEILSDYKIYFFPILFNTEIDIIPINIDFDLKHGSAIFIKKNIQVTNQKNYFIYRDTSLTHLNSDFSNLATPLQSISFKHNQSQMNIFNYHGTAMPGDKLDTTKRLTETKKVLKIINTVPGMKILTGDFNLLPETKSVKEFEENLINLIKEYKILRTRSKISPFWGKNDFQRFADYTFVSKDVKVKSFKVPNVEISDHLPMILEFD